jgi:hypothetical protein
MQYVKWGLISLVFLFVAAFLHYSLPSRDIVRIVGTDVKRMDISPGAWFWASVDSGTNPGETRDVRFVNSTKADGSPRVYRNEDTGWGWPPYFKFDSGDLTAEAQAAEDSEGWYVAKHYGWRSLWLTTFPNLLTIRPATGPDEKLFPWFNIVFIACLLAMLYLVYRFFMRVGREIAEEVDERIDALSENVAESSDNIREEADRLWDRLRRWFERRLP